MADTPQWVSPDPSYRMHKLEPCKGCGELVAMWVTQSAGRTAADRNGAVHVCGQQSAPPLPRLGEQPATARTQPPGALGEMRNDDGSLKGWLVAPSSSVVVVTMPDTIRESGVFTVEGDPALLADYAGLRVALVPIIELDQ